MIGFGLLALIMGVTQQTMAEEVPANIKSSQSANRNQSGRQSVTVQSNDSKKNTSPKSVVRAEVPVDDGIYNWEPAKWTDVGRIDLTDTQWLDYSFINSNGTTKTEVDGATSTTEMFPKPNVYLHDPDNPKGNPAGDVPVNIYDNRGLWPDYGYAIQTNKKTVQEVYRVGSSITEFMQTPHFYKALDAEGKIVALKVVDDVIMGYNQHFQAEILLRPNPNQPVIQREMYFVNLDDKSFEAGFFYAEVLYENGLMKDVLSQGKGQGLFGYGEGVNFYWNLGVDDGPNFYGKGDFTTNGLINRYAYSYFGSFTNPAKVHDAPGLENRYSFGEQTDSEETAPGSEGFTSKWRWQTFEPGQVYHYRNDIGLTSSAAHIVSPGAIKTFTNLTTQDNTNNNVGNKLHFDLEAHNASDDSSWNHVVITDIIPEGLDIDTTSIKLTDIDGTTKSVPGSYNATTRKLSVTVPSAITFAKKATVGFDATINEQATDNIHNEMLAQGDNEHFSKANAHVDIPVKVPLVHFNKLVKEDGKPDTDYAKKAESSVGGTLDYKIKFDVNSQNQTMVAGLSEGTITDALPQGLTLVPNTAKIKYSTDEEATSIDDVSSVKLKAMAAGDTAIITFKAKVASDLAEGTELKNTAVFNGKSAQIVIPETKADATVKVVKPKIGKVIFKYIDRRTGEPLKNDVTVTGTIGKKVSELTTAEVSDGQDPNKIRPAYIENYTPVDFTAGSDLTTSTFDQIRDVDPEITADEATYTFRYERQRLAITALPTKMNFGAFYETQAERTFYLPAPAAVPRTDTKAPYHIEISDYWGISGWSLSVAQEQQFQGRVQHDKQDQTGLDEEQNTKNVELDGAQLRFNNARLLSKTNSQNGTANADDLVTTKSHFNLTPGDTPLKIVDYHRKGQFLMSDGDNKGGLTYDQPGYSTYRYQFGDAQSADYSIGLHVPASTKRYPTYYSAKLRWNLTVAP